MPERANAALTAWLKRGGTCKIEKQNSHENFLLVGVFISMQKILVRYSVRRSFFSNSFARRSRCIGFSCLSSRFLKS